ncbi:hypothetical protein B2K_13790 [Paenibacillus mucilaginosus K02]|uniref:Uncharacterized protein n=1 Tax=Paenibacillus mucilaginosus K02 TaxID=997761 RepID=I0BHC9_9BACL|nr:hypothetical protein B2K_13790 [Paenibacillus mucilaginosus K02]
MFAGAQNAWKNISSKGRKGMEEENRGEGASCTGEIFTISLDSMSKS